MKFHKGMLLLEDNAPELTARLVLPVQLFGQSVENVLARKGEILDYKIQTYKVCIKISSCAPFPSDAGFLNSSSWKSRELGELLSLLRELAEHE